MTGLVLLGPPGAGKGTQAARLKVALGLLHLSTGDALREAVRQGNDLGRRVGAILSSGALVSDALVGEVVEKALTTSMADSAGYILDGFPRTLGQVGILDDVLGRTGLTLDHAVVLESPDAVLIRRLTGRRVCPSCQAVYHMDTKPPRTAGTCDVCQGAIEQRADDSDETVKARLQIYKQQTAPVIEAYDRRGLARHVDGSDGPDAVFARLLAVVRGALV